MTRVLLLFSLLTATELVYAQGRVVRRAPESTPGADSQGASDNINAFPDNCDVPQPASFPTDLKYYQNFHPSDSIFDFWCKVQGLTGSGKYEVKVGTNDNYTFVTSQRFSFDGTPRLSRRHLAKVLTDALRISIQVSRDRAAITRMTVFGFPPETKEGQRAIYGNNQLLLSFEGIEIMGTPFYLTGFFSNSDGAMVKWLTGAESPLEFSAAQRTGVLMNGSVLAVPLVFRAMTLFCDDPKLQLSREEILSTLEKKYGKYKTKPGVYTDQSNGVNVEEGAARRGGKYLKISYAPNTNGPLDPMKSNDLHALVKTAVERHNAAEKSHMDANKGKNSL